VIVKSQTDSFMSWLRGLNTQDAVITYRKQCLTERDILLDKALKQLQNGKNPEVIIAQLATQLTNKFMHAPTNALQSAAQGGELDRLIYLRDIFDINPQD
jgi:glutamyl-tRNA reductase